MRLISLHVESFGRLSDYTLNMEPGLNVILRENGWGKSTLAAFIRVMFYSFTGEGISFMPRFLGVSGLV